MPHYAYHCSQCFHREEILQKMSESPLVQCPQCGENSFQRAIGKGLGLHFQGSGFYATDYGCSIPSDKPSPPAPSSRCGCGKTACQA